LSYSQNDEEKHILEAVEGITHGRFLDIGAWNAKDLSNTRALFELGWSGVMIEPSPEPFLGLLREYGKEDRIQLLCGAVGTSSVITRFWVTADALTTSDEKNFEKWKGVGGFYGSLYTPTVTMAEIIDRFGHFDFVSIDSEGSSADLLHALLATDELPTAICVEYDARSQECVDVAAARGYRTLYTSPENLVLAK
jgi:FkbM family methyltransferase